MHRDKVAVNLTDTNAHDYWLYFENNAAGNSGVAQVGTSEKYRRR